MSEMDSLFQFRVRTVKGEPCACCGLRKPTEKVFIHRSNHPDGESGSFTAFVPQDLRKFVLEAADFLGLDVRNEKRLRATAKTGEDTVYGFPAQTVLDLIYEARRDGRL